MTSDAASVAASPFKLPACERCRKSKIKCDVAVPKCSACTKSSTACIIVDTITGDRYGREQLHNMQQKLETLEARRSQSNSIAPQTEIMSPTAPVSPSARRSHFVGDGSGIDMFHRVSASANTAESRAKILEQLNMQSPRNVLSIPDNDLPSFELASKLIERYCSHAHLLHPLQTKKSTYEMLNRVYQSRSTREVSKQDLYTVFMISAISGVTMFRRGIINEHPYGFYRSASRLISQIPLVGSVQAIQNLLLIARFAMYYHIECSIWDITRLCMRQCVELGLHLRPVQNIPAMQEQLRRNVFWDCYVHDRYSSGILGRPFAISEQEIEVELPLEASEDQILFSGCQTLNEIRPDQSTLPNEASIFHFIIRLRRVTARGQTRFFSPGSLETSRSKTVSSAGEVLRDLKYFLDELDYCQQSAPSFLQPRSLYERSEWHQFMVEKDKLTVIRGAFASLSLCSSHLPRKLLILCLDCAARVIELYINLFSAGAITWTRSYFQILFTSGLSTIYAASQLKATLDDSGLDDYMDRTSQALSGCSELLSRFISEMPDAGRFAVVFEALCKPYTNRVRNMGRQMFTDQSQVDHVQPFLDDNEVAIYDDNTSIAQQIHASLSGLETNHNNQYDFSTFETNLANLDDWSLFPTISDNFLGQMEAGIGQYAWGAHHDANIWQHYMSG